MTELQASRVFTLAYFLRTQVPLENFDIRCIQLGDPRELRYRQCGSAACGLGYCPVVFPSEWTDKYGVVRLRNWSWYHLPNDAWEFFGCNAPFFDLANGTPQELASALIRAAEAEGWECKGVTVET